MKTFAQATVIFMLVIIASFVCFNLVTGSITDNETEVSLSQSVEQALYVTLDGGAYSVNNNQEFINDFLVNLTLQMESAVDLDVRVLDVDYDEGLIDVEVRASLIYPDGKLREVSCRKTVILDGEE